MKDNTYYEWAFRILVAKIKQYKNLFISKQILLDEINWIENKQNKLQKNETFSEWIKG